MKQQKIIVACRMKDCACYSETGNREVCCSHPDKRYHMAQFPCPLYRMDWQRKLALAEQATQPTARRLVFSISVPGERVPKHRMS